MTQPSFSDQIIKPENCVLAFGIPTTLEDFIHDLNHPHKEFAKKYHGIRQRYVEEFLKHLWRTVPNMMELGVKIVHRLTLNDFGALFQEKKNQVIILFSHWRERDEIESVEFFDRFATIPQIIKKIPTDFVGLLDLCVCHPKALTVAMREERPICLTRFSDKRATPFIWLYFYLGLFKHLTAKNLNYLDALEGVIQEFLATTNRQGNDK